MALLIIKTTFSTGRLLYTMLTFYYTIVTISLYAVLMKGYFCFTAKTAAEGMNSRFLTRQQVIYNNKTCCLKNCCWKVVVKS